MLEQHMNPPLPHNGIAFVQVDNKTQKRWVYCPWCGKKAFPIDARTRIAKLFIKCRGSNCKHMFEVNV